MGVTITREPKVLTSAEFFEFFKSFTERTKFAVNLTGNGGDLLISPIIHPDDNNQGFDGV